MNKTNFFRVNEMYVVKILVAKTCENDQLYFHS